MKQKIFLPLVFALTLFTGFREEGKPLKKIVATTSFIRDIAQNIAGDKHKIISLMPIGGDPHIYEPVPQDAQLISEADLVLKNGLHLEGWLDKLINNSGTRASIITVSDGVDAIINKEFHGSPDPHAWMLPTNVIIYAENIKNALSNLEPENAQVYEQNFKTYKQKIEELDQYIFKVIEKIPKEKRILITSHDAFRYYGNHYGITVESVLGTSTDADVQIQDIKRLTDIITKNRIPAVFVESTINPKLLNQLAQDLKIRIGGKLFADSLGDKDSGASTYLDMIRHNTDELVSALSGTHSESEDQASNILFLVVVISLFIGSFALVAVRLKDKSSNISNWKDYKIVISGLSVSYGRKTILNNIYMDIAPGRLYGVIGPNGAGKSTLFKAILGLVKPDSGTITINHQSIENTRKYVAYIPQKEEIDWSFPATVIDVVLMGRYPFKKVFEKFNLADYRIAEEAMQKLDILDLKNKQIGELSGGQQQRVFLARALCQHAEVYLFDEPFVGVDITTEEKIIQILKTLAEEGKTLIVIHHDLSKVKDYFDSVIMINQRLVAAGDAETVFTDENIKKTYSGQSTIIQDTEKYIHSEV